MSHLMKPRVVTKAFIASETLKVIKCYEKMRNGLRMCKNK